MHNHINLVVGNNCLIDNDAKLENVTCGNNVIINGNAQLKNITIGSNSKISRNTILYSPQKEQPIIVGKSVWISHGVFAEATGGTIIIDDYSVIAHFTSLLTSNGPGERSIILNELFPLESGNITVNKHCWIGANTLVLPHVSFAQGVVIASNSVVKQQEFLQWSVYAGNPARHKKQFNLMQIEQLKEKFKSNLNP